MISELLEALNVKLSDFAKINFDMIKKKITLFPDKKAKIIKTRAIKLLGAYPEDENIVVFYWNVKFYFSLKKISY
jgi:hypothetical protein